MNGPRAWRADARPHVVRLTMFGGVLASRAESGHDIGNAAKY